MQKFYSIIIPVYNEASSIPKLLSLLKQYSLNGHEIIIVDDGSNDGSKSILKKCDFIKLISLKNNCGKGIALKNGLIASKNNKTIIFDGDLELNPNEIVKLMILNDNSESIFATRYNKITLSSFWNLGNLFLTTLFNFINGSNVKDALCCAKTFYKSNINLKKLSAKKFNIDIEIAGQLVKKNNIKNILIKYNRRNKEEGKKLRFRDGFSIIFQIIKDK